ncbi:hypothetical protein [Ornithinimicrobium pekingense]|uniref:Transcriptional regulator, AbiEi antitoxin, Type IV TA system n=1 Tax=Ornithinimicrobium pekingense TaxID=384677 RepID=A0ABQ2FA82_9MICO|nr:hypothetical protein [Ornithinimicrobium pekingense]GGK76845.1 hypothetical protein GCM10011509_26790 [Ornithinimicrobium pekingense]
MSPSRPTVPFTYQDAVERYSGRRSLDRRLRDGDVCRLGRGIYAEPLTLGSATETWVAHRTEHLHRLRAALHRFPGMVASHTSAAVVHGLELVIAAETPVELTVVRGAPQSRSLPGVRIHHTDSTVTPHVLVDDIRTTTIARTVADVLRTRRAPHAVAMTDRAVADGAVDLAGITAALDAQVRWKGRPRARESLAAVDLRRESWLESYSFVALHEQGHPLPLPQVSVHDEHLRFVGRVDGLWPREKVFAEADGEGKYFLGPGDQVPLEPETTVRRRLAEERERHARLEALGLVGVRWTGEEIMNRPEAVALRVELARERARGMQFHGWVRRGADLVRLESLFAA